MHSDDIESQRDDEGSVLDEDRRKAERRAEQPPRISPDEFRQWRSPRTVSGGPVSLDNPLWHWLVRTGLDAWNANRLFEGPSAFEDGPMWCFDRFGQSVTQLPDGRLVHIGGEHEDHYDPDFFIYNDVVLIDPEGRISILGYGRDIFPPTDFHSATLIGERLYLIGRLGYPEERQVGVTPVFVLDLDQMSIRAVVTQGESPGWIFKHVAEPSEDGRSVVVSGGQLWRGPNLSSEENIDRWSLELDSGRWTRLTRLDWQRWTVLPIDRKRNRLWDTRQEQWRREHGWPGMGSGWNHDQPPDLEALSALYRIDDAAAPPTEGSVYNEYIAIADGIRIRFTEERWEVKVIVEGRLAPERLEALQRRTLATLERINGSGWELEAAQ